MADAFYAGPEGEVEETSETVTAEATPDSIDEEEAANPTALIPTSALGGKVKAGDTVTIRVVKIYDDEAEVEISSASEKSKPEAMSSDMELEAMAEEMA